jgi:hypothetical protein
LPSRESITVPEEMMTSFEIILDKVTINPERDDQILKIISIEVITNPGLKSCQLKSSPIQETRIKFEVVSNQIITPSEEMMIRFKIILTQIKSSLLRKRR